MIVHFVIFLLRLHKTQVGVTEESYAVSLLDSEKKQENNDAGGVGFD